MFSHFFYKYLFENQLDIGAAGFTVIGLKEAENSDNKTVEGFGIAGFYEFNAFLDEFCRFSRQKLLR